ncbi:MAG TPA: hypothetical protein PK668_10680 [Myxococcota bacterium]|nr:hypothetical protein [Myxococcota bacterium]HRY93372.1 hypothetical protein [Myxococcota bacterium]HSA22246.1 hypothetical protein [Myxococcota bacterium]
MAGSTKLMDLVGKEVTAWFDGSYFKCEVVAFDPQFNYIKMINKEEPEPAAAWYALHTVSRILES